MDNFTVTDTEDGYNDQFTSESFLDNLEGNLNDEEIPDITDDQESENDTIQDEYDTPEITEWSMSLADVPKALRISELGHTYIYGRLRDPDGSPTNKFHGFFRNNLSENSTWKSLPGVLSDRYVVVSLDKFINDVIKTKFINIVEYPIINKEPWKLAWIGTIENSEDYIIKYIDDDTVSLIFKNISKDVVINSIISKFGFIITNTYNGTNKLKISPIVRTIGTVEGGENLNFIDYFTFCNFTQMISHSSKGVNIENDLITIKENINEHVSILKEFINTSSIIRSISSCFRKPGKNTFNLVLEEADKNLFTVLIAASIALGKKYSIIEHLAIRSKILAFLEQVF